MIRAALVAASGVGIWMWYRGHRDPREWPGELSAEWARLRVDLKEAADVGGRAAARREEEIDRELDAAAGRPAG